MKTLALKLLFVAACISIGPLRVPAQNSAPPSGSSARTQASSPEILVTLYVTSNPDGAEINLDDAFVGKAPMTLKLLPGRHSIRMFMNDYHNWSQWITVEAGPDVHIAATLEKSLHFEQTVPNGDAVLFVSPQIGGKSFGFFRAPDGTAAAVPVSEVKDAMDAGYKPVTFGDMLQVIDSYAKTIQDQQKKLNDFSSDYNALVERYNRLAAISSTPAANYAASQANDERRAMRLMLFQSLLSRTTPQAPVRIEVTNCTAFPALCVH
jgi:hypothetical protein